MALLALASLEMAESHPQRRRHALANEALIYAREAGDDRLAALALFERALALPPDQGVEALDQAATALRKIGSFRVLPHLYSNAAYNAIKAGDFERARALLDLAIPLAHELDSPVTLVLVLGNVGLAALFTDDLERAKNAFNEQLRICRELVVTHLAAEGFGGLAAIEARTGDLERAGRLLGAATATGPIGDADVNGHLEEQFFAPARARYGARRWNEAHAAGAEMTFEQAFAFALSR